MGKIFYIMGKSATGKDRVFSQLKVDTELNLRTVILYTTRPIRCGEVDGADYHFIKEEDVNELKASGRIIEMRSYETVHGIWRYITLDDGQFASADSDYLIIGTLESYRMMQDYFGKERVVPIYITVEDGIRLERALGREKQQERPKYAELCRRFLADEEDFSEEKLKEAGISTAFVNHSFCECLKEIKEYIKKCRS